MLVVMMLGGLVLGLLVPGLGLRGRLVVWGVCGGMIVLVASPAGGMLLNTSIVISSQIVEVVGLVEREYNGVLRRAKGGGVVM